MTAVSPDLGDDELASFGQRAFARSTDLLVLAMIGAAVLAPSAQRNEANELVSPSWSILATLTMWLLYETLMVYFLGFTAGKMALGCKVVDRRTGEKPSLIQAGARSLVLVGLVRIFGAYGLLILVTPVLDRVTRRGALDWVAGTVVVQARPPAKEFPPEFDNSDGRFN